MQWQQQWIYVVRMPRHEGQGAIELEMKVSTHLDQDGLIKPAVGAYGFATKYISASENRAALWEIDSTPMWFDLLDDLQQSITTEIIATRFHAGLVKVIDTMIGHITEQHSITTVALSGGCLQNKVLLENLAPRIQARGLVCLSQSQFPSNDGGISLGQVAIAAAQQLVATHNTHQ